MAKNWQKFFFKSLRALALGASIIILSSVGIDAVDHRDNLSESIAGRLILGKAKGPCPEDMVFVEADWGGYCLDKYENSAGKDCPHDKPSDVSQSRQNLDLENCQAVSRAEVFPWTNISQNQASRACLKAGKRLASNREWSRAALGTPDAFSDWSKEDCQVAKNWDKQPGLTGSGKKCVSYSGAYDMIGNVWEWVDGSVSEGVFQGKSLPQSGFVFGIDEADGLPSGTKDALQPDYYSDYLWIKDKGVRAISRGGYWGNKQKAGQYAHYIVSPPTYVGGAVGFRCAKKAGTDR